MPRDITVTFADGTTHTYQGAPDTVTPDEVQTRAEKQFAKTVKSMDGGRNAQAQTKAAIEPPQESETSLKGVIGDSFIDLDRPRRAAVATRQGLRDLYSGMIRGAGSIGATLLAPVDMYEDYVKGDREQTLSGLITGKKPISRNQERRQMIDRSLQDLTGADPESLLYKTGKITGEVAGTAGAGGLLAKPVQAVAPRLANAISSSGFTTGSNLAKTAPIAEKAADLGIRMTGGAITGGASAGLIDPQNAATGAAVGAVLPAGIAGFGAAGQKAGEVARNALKSDISPEVAGLAKRAKELGIDIPADRIANSKVANAVASGLNYVPFSGRAATEELMNSQLNKALSKTFGQDSSNVTMALRRANDELGAKFEHVLRNNGVKFDQKLLDDVIEVQTTAEKELGADALKPITNQVNELLAKSKDGLIDGQAAYNIKRTLDRLGRGNTPTSYHALELKDKLMDALNRSLGPEQAAKFATTRKQYSNMLALEKLATNGAEGEISAARLANMKNINNSELQELADIAAQFVKPREGQHGAMQRGFAAMGIGGMMGLPSLAVTAGAGRLTNKTLNSNSLKQMMLGLERDPGATERLLASPELKQLLLKTAPSQSPQLIPAP